QGRDRRLPGRRPQVRQRHRALAALAHVRLVLVADGQPVRHEPAPPRRQRDGAPDRGRAAAAPEDQGPDAAEGEGGRRAGGLPAALDERAPPGLYRVREAPVRQRLVLALRRRAADRPRRHETEAEAEGARGADGRGRPGRPDGTERARPRLLGWAAGTRPPRPRRPRAARLRPLDRLAQPLRQPGRAKGVSVDERVQRPAVCDGYGAAVAHALDEVVEAETRAARVAAAQVDAQAVVEAGGG